MKTTILILILSLTGCSSIRPYVSYEHDSDPRIHGDGYNDLCGGLSRRGEHLQLRGGICANQSENGGERFKGSVMWVF